MSTLSRLYISARVLLVFKGVLILKLSRQTYPQKQEYWRYTVFFSIFLALLSSAKFSQTF